MSQKLDRALWDIAIWHRNQVDLHGDPYILHLLRVAADVSRDNYDEETVIVALLHDILEDTECPPKHILDTYGADIADAVEAMTKRQSDGPYAEYICNKVANSKRAVAVKKADLRDNMLPWRSVLNGQKQKLYPEALKYLEGLSA